MPGFSEFQWFPRKPILLYTNVSSFLQIQDIIIFMFQICVKSKYSLFSYFQISHLCPGRSDSAILHCVWGSGSEWVYVCVCLFPREHMYVHSCIWGKFQPRVRLILMTQTSVSRTVWCIRAWQWTNCNANLGSVVNQLHWPHTRYQSPSDSVS